MGKADMVIGGGVADMVMMMPIKMGEANLVVCWGGMGEIGMVIMMPIQMTEANLDIGGGDMVIMMLIEMGVTNLVIGGGGMIKAVKDFLNFLVFHWENFFINFSIRHNSDKFNFRIFITSSD